MKRVLCLAVLLALLAVPVSAITSEEYMKLFEKDNKITKDELADAIISYMLGESALKIDEVRDAANVYVYWNGEPKTVVDAAGRTVTFYRPPKHLILINSKSADTLRALGIDLEDKVAGVTNYILKNPEYYPELQDKPGFNFRGLDYEKIAELNADLLINYNRSGQKFTNVEELESLGVKVLFLELFWEEKQNFYGSIRVLGQLFDKEEKTEEFIQWLKDYENLITNRTANLREKDKLKVLWLSYPDYYYPTLKVTTGESGDHDLIVKAGGINIAENLTGGMTVEVSGEWIAKENPDIIIAKVLGGHYTGYSVNETEAISNMKEIRDKLMNDPALNTTNAVKNGKVYVMCTDLIGDGWRPAGLAYLAKWFHPELFKDLKPESILKEYLENWQGMPYRGVYVYPK